MVDVSLSGKTGTGSFVGSNSPTITTPIIASIRDVNGLNLLTLGTAASAVNFASIANASTGSPVQFLALGSDASVTYGMYAKGGIFLIADFNATVAAKLRYYAGDNLHYTSLGVATAQAVSLDLILPSVDVTNGVMQSNGSGTLFLTATPTLTSINLGGSTLSNYLVSTWTPIVTLVGGAGNTVPVYTTNTGVYTRIGNVVYVDILLSGDGGAEGAGTGQITISLPIAASALNSGAGIGVSGAGLNSTSRQQLFPSISSGASTASIFYWSAINTYVPLTGADQNNTARSLALHFFYFV